jgi:hypothetical protein
LNPPSRDESSNSAFAELVKLVESGAYLRADPVHVRTLYARSPVPRGETEGPAGAIKPILRAYVKRQPETFLGLAGNDQTRQLIGPLIGDPHFKWPFEDPLNMPDAEALKWLPLGNLATVSSDSLIHFVRVMFCSVRRAIWRPAARTLAALAAGHPDLARELIDLRNSLFQRSFTTLTELGGEHPKKDLLPPPYEPLRAVHLRRHLFVALCDFVATTGSALGDTDARTLLGVSAESMINDADLSAVLLGWESLSQGSDRGTRRETLQRVADLCRGNPAGAADQSEQALRDILRSRREDDADEARTILDFLIAPRWRHRPLRPRVNLLWSWLQTARFCSELGLEDALAVMRREAGEASPALEYAVSGRLHDDQDPPDVLLPRLAVVADPVRWPTTTLSRRAICIVEAMQLLDHPEVRDMPFDALVLRATGREAQGDGSGRGVPTRNHRVGLALLLGDRGHLQEALLRDLELDEPAVLSLAASQNTYIARQVAVQAERLLRGRPPNRQLRLLWKILEQDPPTELLDELRSALPGYGTRLHALVDELRTLDEARTGNTSVLETAARYQCVATCAQRLCGDKTGPAGPGEHLTSMAHSFERLTKAGRARVGSPEWLELVEALLFGPTRARRHPDETGQSRGLGLVDWLEWITVETNSGHDVLTGRPADPARYAVETAWDALREAAGVVSVAEPYVSVQQCHDLARALEDLKAVFPNRTWPEHLAFSQVVRDVDEWRARELGRARDREAADARVRALMERADEQGLVAMLCGTGSERAAQVDTVLMSPGTLRAAHLHLLGALRLGHAAKLRRRAAHVRLPRGLVYLAPLFIGTLAGIWLVLDVATDFTNLVAADRRGALALAIGLAHGAAFLVAATSLSSGLGRGASWLDRSKRAGRLLALHGGAYGLSLVNTTFVMWLLQDTELVVVDQRIAQVVLWSSLALFLGLFLGLILQGRAFTTRGRERAASE